MLVDEDGLPVRVPSDTTIVSVPEPMSGTEAVYAPRPVFAPEPVSATEESDDSQRNATEAFLVSANKKLTCSLG